MNAVPTTWLPEQPSLKAYHDLLGGTSGRHAGGTVTEAGTFSRSVYNSAILAAVSTFFILIFSTMAAYAVARLRFRFGGAVMALLVGTMIVPIFVIVVSLFDVLAHPPVGPSLIDTKGGLVLVFTATLTPLATWLLYTQVREMPPEPEEAALIDGCSRWKAFVRIVVPQMSSGIAAVAAITMLSVWGEFLIPLLLTQTMNAKPVTVQITEYVGKYSTNYPILAAAGVLALIPPALLALSPQQAHHRHAGGLVVTGTISLEEVTKHFPGGVVAVNELSLEVEPGEFLVLVGPSGCGKTTALRMVAGLEPVTSGEIRINDRVVTRLPPRNRDIAMVFQNYALYAHMTVRNNMAFGLKMAHMPRSEIRMRVDEAATMLGLTDLLDRKPRQLSGGQRQRVAMGRAIVREPAAFLMDEPLSNLDAKLRVEMRGEIIRVQRRIAAPTLYVTHDQTEAMTMGDRVAILRDGVLQQLGSPDEIYDRPVNVFVAGFIGSPSMNLIPAKLDGSAAVFGGSRLELPPALLDARPGLAPFAGRDIVLGIRPEDFTVAGDGPLELTVARVESLGSELVAYLDAGTMEVTARLERRAGVEEGGPVRLGVALDRLYFFDPEGGAAVS